MKNKLSKYLLTVISIIFIFTFTFTFIIINMPHATEKTFRRDELQDMLVATALSYHYNSKYIVYNQYSKDKSDIRDNLTYYHTYSWLDFNTSPEETSRINMFSSDCSAFAYLIYLNTLGYDFSEYYKLNAYNYFKNGKKYPYYSMSDNAINTYNESYYTERIDQNLYQEMLKRTGRGIDSAYFINIIKQEIKDNSDSLSELTGSYINNDSNSTLQGVYMYENTSNTVEDIRNDISSKRENIFSEIKDILKPGDIIIYNRKIKNEDGTVSTNSAHVLFYIKDAINKNEIGVIHSTGSDYTYNEDGTMKSAGHDRYGVRYNLLDEMMEKNILVENDTTIGYRVAVLRPLNKFCESDEVCKMPTGEDSFSKAVDTSMLENSKARTELSRLNIEQYVEIKKEHSDINITKKETLQNAISKFNSVNINDVITYKLEIKNKANLSYCESNGYDRYYQSRCEEDGYEWRYSERSDEFQYKNITITSKIPDNTEYIEGSCTNNCTYDEDTKTITWEVPEIKPADKQVTSFYNYYPTYNFDFSVKPINEGVITNEGIKIITESGNILKLGKLETKVNPTINGLNMEVMKSYIDKFTEKYNEGLIKYNNTNETNYKINLDNITNEVNLSKSDFIKTIYYNAFGIELEDLYKNDNYDINNDKMFNGIFKKKTIKLSSYNFDIYTKKTDEESKMLEENEATIAKMLVPGMYGGRYLRGNENGDRESHLRVRYDNFNAGTGMND